MKFRIALLALILFAAPAFAQQAVQQSGSVTKGHVPYWVTSGAIGDGGSATNSPITSIGVTNNGGAGICVSSDVQTAAGRNQLCFGASTNGPATISLQNYGTAPTSSFQFIVNGAAQGFLTVSPLPVTIGNLACFAAVGGGLKDCGIAGGTALFANPTAATGSIVVNGSATTAMRSDAAPALAANGVLNSNLAQMQANTIKGNNTGSPANAIDLTVAQIKPMLSVEISVTDPAFGADPTGVADSTTAIQNAINSLPVTGGTIIFPNGTYKITSTLTIGNGTTSAISTRQGVILKGLGNSETTGFFINSAPANSPGVKLFWAGSVGGTIMKLAGPLQGWGLQDIFMDCSSSAAIGLEVLSGLYGNSRDLTISNCTTVGLYSHAVPQNSIGDTNSERNFYQNLFVAVPNVASAQGIDLTGQVPFVNALSNTDFNTFINLGIVLPLTSTQTFGIILKGTDSNEFFNTQIYGGGSTSIPVNFDYTSGTAGWPASNAFYGIDPGGGVSTTTFLNTGTPSGATPNYIYGLVETNGAAAPNIANLSVFGSHNLVLSSGGNSTNAQLTTDTAGHFGYKGVAPTLTGCNGAGSFISGNDNAGFAGGQTAVATQCVLTFAHAYPAAPSCTATGSGVSVTASVTTTALTVNFASTASQVINYDCHSIN